MRRALYAALTDAVLPMVQHSYASMSRFITRIIN